MARSRPPARAIRNSARAASSVLPGAEPPVVHTTYERGDALRDRPLRLAVTDTQLRRDAACARPAALLRRPELRDLVLVEVYGSALDPLAAQLLESLALTDVVTPFGRLEFDPPPASLRCN